ncbi:MAG: insulinase family protein [Spirochaetaceae bacterium]
MNYELLSERELPDHNARGLLYRHIESGCEIFHVANDDRENLFAFGFKTVPEESTGVAHILEHTVLNGSESFPVKDPFLRLLKGSVYTFLNAITFPDKTIYPAASTVEQDLFNMMEVYGDAVFFPQLKRQLFRQEGHRLEFDEEGRLTLTGVVYNEMKGNYSSHDSIASEWCYRSIFPDTTYGEDSGGDPREIPKLTYDQFVEFHRKFYHPSNARIFLYGNIPTQRYLDFLHERFLSRFERKQAAVDVPLQKAWKEPRELTVYYPADGSSPGEERKSSVTVNWLLFPSTDPYLSLAFGVLADLLLGTSGSPLQKALVESGLGEDLSAPTGYETELRQAVFSVGLRGTEESKKQEIESLIYEVLRRLAEEGLDPELVEASLRRIEFRNREIRGGGPQGLRLMRKSMRGWMHGFHPADYLDFSSPFSRLRQALSENPRYLEGLIKEYLLENAHRSTVIVKPDSEMAEREAQELRSKLAQMADAMSEEERRRLEEENRELRELQQAPDPPEELAKIPFLRLHDIPREVVRIPGYWEPMGDVPLHSHTLFTNGIVYVDFVFDLHDLTPEEERYLPLLAHALTETGLPGMSYDRLLQQINMHTGGIGASVASSATVPDPNRVRMMLNVRVKMLEERLDEGLSLFRRILLEPDFSDHRRLEDLVYEVRNDMVSSLVPSGHSYAMNRAARLLSASSAVDEQWHGIEQLRFLDALAQKDGVPKVAQTLAKLRRRVIESNRLSVNLTCDGEIRGGVAERLSALVSEIPPGDSPRLEVETVQARLPESCAPRVEGIAVSSSVNFVAMALRSSPVGSPEQPGEEALAQLMRTGALWEKIRMEGGAYGAFASNSATERTFLFGSYRDPQVYRTLQAYRNALEELASTPVDSKELELTLIGLLGKELRPMVPREQGMVSFRRDLIGVTDELRQSVRDRLRELTPEEVRLAAQRLLKALDGASIAVVGGAAALNEASEKEPALKENRLELHL